MCQNRDPCPNPPPKYGSEWPETHNMELTGNVDAMVCGPNVWDLVLRVPSGPVQSFTPPNAFIPCQQNRTIRDTTDPAQTRP